MIRVSLQSLSINNPERNMDYRGFNVSGHLGPLEDEFQKGQFPLPGLLKQRCSFDVI